MQKLFIKYVSTPLIWPPPPATQVSTGPPPPPVVHPQVVQRGDGSPGGSGPATGYVDWLYLDEELRVTRGSKGSLFIHKKESSTPLFG